MIGDIINIIRESSTRVSNDRGYHIISYIHKKWNLLLEYQVIGDIINIIKESST